MEGIKALVLERTVYRTNLSVIEMLTSIPKNTGIPVAVSYELLPAGGHVLHTRRTLCITVYCINEVFFSP